MSRIRIGVAGLGAVAQSVHLPLLQRRWDLFELVAVADLSPSSVSAVGEQFGVDAPHRYASLTAMLLPGDELELAVGELEDAVQFRELDAVHDALGIEVDTEGFRHGGSLRLANDELDRSGGRGEATGGKGEK